MRKEQVGLATGAPADGLDGAWLETRVQQLPTISLSEIEVKAGADRRVTWRSLGQEKHGVFCANRVGIADFNEQVARIDEL